MRGAGPPRPPTPAHVSPPQPGHGSSQSQARHLRTYHLTRSRAPDQVYLRAAVNSVGLLGLSLLLAGARRTSRRGREARRGLTQSRRETAAVSQDRDDLIHQRESAYTASRLGNGDGDASPRAGRLCLLARRPAEAPASAPAPAE